MKSTRTVFLFIAILCLTESLLGEESHWAWLPLNPEIQKRIASQDLTSQDIDAYIEKRLESKGLQLSPRASQRVLIRRLSFTLRGLPPYLGDVEAFESYSDQEAAYSRWIDKFLKSSSYGERMAQHWLDLAHYADTHGFERDMRRDTAWRYRDYVIQSFNKDKPYNQFLEEQIAGDVLWPGRDEANIATGFLAAGPWDFVGQVENKSPVSKRKARALDLDDMITQVMSTTIATTANCARCHDHKLDPISQKDYYGLKAVFASLKREERIVNPAELTSNQQMIAHIQKKTSELLRELRMIENSGLSLADIVGGGDGWGSGKVGLGIDPRTGSSVSMKRGGLNPSKVNIFSTVNSPFIEGVFIPEGQGGKAKIPYNSTGDSLTGIPSTSKATWDAIRKGPVNSQHSPSLAGVDFTKGGNELLGLHANSGITFDLKAFRNELKTDALKLSAKVGYFGSKGSFFADVWIYVDGEKVFEVRGLKRDDGLKDVEIKFSRQARYMTLISTDGGNGYSHDQVCFTNATLKNSNKEKLNSEQIKERQLKIVSLQNRIHTVSRPLDRLRDPQKFYGTVSEKTSPEIRVLDRGDTEHEVGEPLKPATLPLLSMLDHRLGDHETPEAERRIRLARWITDPKNPLTARVIVNRLWQWHFGHGLVRTPSDFGKGGEQPSHPELLDALALQLIKNSWSLKSVQRLILNTKTFKQKSQYLDGALGQQRDAENRLLWRQNPRRLEAEAIRDYVLSMGGQLNDKAYGPGYEDFKYTQAYAPIYQYVVKDDRDHFRRSIYRYRVRTTPNRFLTTLDCPDLANITPKRLTSTTALQSLALFNNEFILLHSRYFSAYLKKKGREDVGEQVRLAFMLAYSRSPNAEELTESSDFIRSQGLLAFVRAILNSNEFYYID